MGDSAVSGSTGEAPPIRIVIVDDHTLFRNGLRALISSVAGMEVVAECADAEAAVRAAVETRPDVMLLDIQLPGASGIEAIPSIRRSAPGVAIVMLTMVEPGESLTRALHDGALGYVLKGAEQSELVDAIRAAAKGQLLLSSAVAERLTEAGGSSGGRWSPPLPQLSEREREVVDLVARGLEVEQIARTLHLSAKSVRNYLASIPRKLGASTRAEMIEVARAAGLGR